MGQRNRAMKAVRANKKGTWVHVLRKDSAQDSATSDTDKSSMPSSGSEDYVPHQKALFGHLDLQPLMASNGDKEKWADMGEPHEEQQMGSPCQSIATEMTTASSGDKEKWSELGEALEEPREGSTCQPSEFTLPSTELTRNRSSSFETLVDWGDAAVPCAGDWPYQQPLVPEYWPYQQPLVPEFCTPTMMIYVLSPSGSLEPMLDTTGQAMPSMMSPCPQQPCQATWQQTYEPMPELSASSYTEAPEEYFQAACWLADVCQHEEAADLCLAALGQDEEEVAAEAKQSGSPSNREAIFEHAVETAKLAAREHALFLKMNPSDASLAVWWHADSVNMQAVGVESGGIGFSLNGAEIYTHDSFPPQDLPSMETMAVFEADTDAAEFVAQSWRDEFYEEPYGAGYSQCASFGYCPHWGCTKKHVNFLERTAESGDSGEHVQETTTLMIHNLPCQYTREMFVKEIDTMGLEGKYDFVHVPIDRVTGRSIGYVFVNFRTPEDAEEATQLFDGHYLQKFQRSRRGNVPPMWTSKAHLQGRQRNLEHYKNTTTQPLIIPRVP